MLDVTDIFNPSSNLIDIETEWKRITQIKKGFKRLYFEAPSGERDTAKGTLETFVKICL